MKFVPSFSTILAVLACWLCQSASLHSQPWPAEWKLVPVQDTDGNWKQAIRVSTLPGVVYHLQYTPSLAIPGTPDWTTIASRYGMGETWICPVLPGQPPSPGTPLPETTTLPETSSLPVLQANLTLGRNALGQTTLSWISLDDRTMKRKVLPGVTLDSIWEDMDSIYLQPHGDHFFAISPRLAEPSAIDASSASFGPLDEAMLAGFEANLDSITAHLLQNAPSSPAYLPPRFQCGAPRLLPDRRGLENRQQRRGTL